MANAGLLVKMYRGNHEETFVIVNFCCRVDLVLPESHTAFPELVFFPVKASPVGGTWPALSGPQPYLG